MKLPKKKAKVVLETVATLESDRIIAPEVASAIRANVEPMGFDWRRLARYSFVAALCCVVIALVATFCDEYVIELLNRAWAYIRQFLRMPPIVRSVGVAIASALVIWLGLKRRATNPTKIYSNEAVFTIGALGFACSIYLFCRSINVVDAHFVLLASSLLYFFLGFGLESKLIWAYGILTVSSALGTDVDYGWGCYSLGMNYPLRTVVLGAVLLGGATLAAYAINPSLASLKRRVDLLFGVTRVFGLLHLFMSLWILSLWGSDWDYHPAVNFRSDLMWWSLAFGAVAVGTVVWGLFKDDGVLRGFGLTFFFIELYTKFFEYFWNGLHKAIFFALLGLSFWLVGRKAEAMWTMKLSRTQSKEPS